MKINDIELEKLEKSMRKNFRILANGYCNKVPFYVFYVAFQAILCEAVFNSAPTKEMAIDLIKSTISEAIKQTNESMG